MIINISAFLSKCGFYAFKVVLGFSQRTASKLFSPHSIQRKTAMKKAYSIRNTLCSLAIIAALAGCQNIPKADELEDSIPQECSLPSGVEVESISLDASQAGDINSSPKGYDVTVKLNRELNDGEIAVVCYAVRDVQVTPKIIAGGFVGILPGQGDEVTRADNVKLACDSNDDVTGAQTGLMAPLNASSNERNTKFYVQHIKGIKNFLNIPSGINGEKSNKIRVKCPR